MIISKIFFSSTFFRPGLQEISELNHLTMRNLRGLDNWRFLSNESRGQVPWLIAFSAATDDDTYRIKRPWKKSDNEIGGPSFPGSFCFLFYLLPGRADWARCQIRSSRARTCCRGYSVTGSMSTRLQPKRKKKYRIITISCKTLSTRSLKKKKKKKFFFLRFWKRKNSNKFPFFFLFSKFRRLWIIGE